MPDPNGATVALKAALVPSEFFTTTEAGPEPTFGTTKLICPGLMGYAWYTGI